MFFESMPRLKPHFCVIRLVRNEYKRCDFMIRSQSYPDLKKQLHIFVTIMTDSISELG